MSRRHLALYHLTVMNGRVVCEDGSQFDSKEYSRFKYGYAPPAWGYGRGLADLVADELLAHAPKGHKTVIISAPYKALPTASHAIARALLQALSSRFIRAGVEPPVLVPLHKARVGSSMYARSSEEERRRSLATLGLRIDADLVRGANVLVVDDIRITGSAEASTRAYLDTLEPTTTWYLHAARLDDEVARRHPGIEDVLNQTFEKSLGTILQDELEGCFVLNTRVARFIMETTDEAAFRRFVAAIPVRLLQELYEGVMGSGLAYVVRYPSTYSILEAECALRLSQGRFALSR